MIQDNRSKKRPNNGLGQSPDPNPHKDPPSGYRLFARPLDNNDSGEAKGSTHGARLLLPDRLAKELADEANHERELVRQRVAERDAERLRELERRVQEESRRVAAEEPRKPIPPAFPRKKEEFGVGFDFEAELALVTQVAQPVADLEDDARKQFLVYPATQPVHWIHANLRGTPDRDLRQRDHALYLQLKEKGPLRRLAAPQDVQATLAALRESQPHFEAVIDLIAAQHALAQTSQKAFYLPPMLLAGEPGVGKTHFALAVAKALGTQVHRLPFDGERSGAALMGSDRKWGNTFWGAVFEQVVLGEFANPLIIVDEIDKAGRDSYGRDPRGALLTLLEPVSNTRVSDISANFEFDASQVIWIATANDLRNVSAPLRSRFREFVIPLPTAEQAFQSAPGIIASAIHSLGIEDFEPAGREITVRVAHLSAREIFQVIVPAVGRALANQRRHLRVSDLPPDLQDRWDDENPAAPSQLH